MNRWLLVFAVLASFFVAPIYAQTFENVAKVQSSLVEDFNALTIADESEQPFLEDILRRKNEALRSQIVPIVKPQSENKAVDELIIEQMTLLQKLLDRSETKIITLVKQSRAETGDEKLRLELLVQRRIFAMDTYYQQMAETLIWAKGRQLDVSSQEKTLTDALTDRSEFLANAILFLDSQKQELKKRMSFVVPEQKAALSAELNRHTERIGMMVKSLESGINLMGSYGIDVTNYKQILLSITGDINADVLDFDVALGMLDEWLVSFKEWAFTNTPSMVVKFLLFIGILYVTRLFSRVVSKAVGKSVSHSKMKFSVLMQDFFISIASKAVVFIGLLIALSQVGIELAPLLTGFGVAGVIIGFALQDTLSNFASGLMILIYRPYDVGDMVKVAGIQGTVKNMSLVSTTVQTIDNQRLVIPNNKIWGDVINNITAEQVRRVDMVFGIGYSDDIDKAKAVLSDILEQHPMVLKTPDYMVKLHTLNSSSVDFVVRPWVKTVDYWDVYWDVTETVKKRFDEEGITIPFPQRDVHVYSHDA